ncbi:MAG: hypothetical protein AAF708_20915 [Deinococcota bacterium]
MNTMRDEAIGAFNAFVTAQQALPGEAALSLVLFDHEYTLSYEAQPLADVTLLDKQSYVPRGTTALLDALGKSIDDAGKRFANMPEAERPNQVIFCILTDGLENASKTYSHADVAAKIKHQREIYTWEFVFLAANQDAFAEGNRLNIPANTTFAYSATKEGTQAAFGLMDDAVRKLRSRPNKS